MIYVFSLLLTAQSHLVPAMRARDPLPLRQVDHVMIWVADPAPVLRFLADTLGLPIAWPIARFGEFRSGAVDAGNVVLEVFEAAAEPRPRFGGIAFEPTGLSQTIPALQRRGLVVGQPMPAGPFAFVHGDSVAWTTAELPQLGAPNLFVFLCEYSRPDIHRFHEELTHGLRASHGGPLSIEAMSTLLVGAGRDSSEFAAWARLAGTRTMASRVLLRFAEGPTVIVDRDAPRGLRRVVLRVRSLDRAAAYLKRHRLLGSRRRGELQLAPSRTFGLDVRLAAGDT